MSLAPDAFASAGLVPHLSSEATTREPSPTPQDPFVAPHVMQEEEQRASVAAAVAAAANGTAAGPVTPQRQQLESDSESSDRSDRTRSPPSESDDSSASVSNSSNGSPVHSSIRRTKSSIVTGSSPDSSARVTKHLRFTAVGGDTTGRLGRGTHLEKISTSTEVYYPGANGHGGSIGHVKRSSQTFYTEPGTPNLSETADQIRRTISLASLDSLIALHNNPEDRARFIEEATRAGRGLLWRDKDEKRVFPEDAERAIVLALKRGLRSFILAFSIRSGVNVILLLFTALRRRKMTIGQIRKALLGPDSFRFGMMVGTFTFLNTLTLHLLRLAPPVSYIRRRMKAGLFSKTTFGPPEREGDEGEHRWHAAVAGAVGSLGLLWETASKRTGVAQQMFVRGLQASYNQYTPRMGIRIPHGDVILFGLCCGQIMYAFLLAPETLAREYNSWIQSASGVPVHAVISNRTVTRSNVIAPVQLQRAMQYPGVTDKHLSTLKALQAKIADGGDPEWHIPCAVLHPWVDSCIICNFNRFFTRFRFMLPVYSALHIIPMLVFRRNQVAAHPAKMAGKALWGITRSCSFLGFFIVINQVLFCGRSQLMDRFKLPPLIQSILSRKEVFWVMGFLNALSLFAEDKKRRAELAMYVLPKALESGWSAARKRAWVPLVPFGESILAASAMAMVMDGYKHQPKAVSGLVRGLLYQLVGPV